MVSRRTGPGLPEKKKRVLCSRFGIAMGLALLLRGSRCFVINYNERGFGIAPGYLLSTPF